MDRLGLAPRRPEARHPVGARASDAGAASPGEAASRRDDRVALEGGADARAEASRAQGVPVDVGQANARAGAGAGGEGADACRFGSAAGANKRSGGRDPCHGPEELPSIRYLINDTAPQPAGSWG
jgi:hypothetical protein